MKYALQIIVGNNIIVPDWEVTYCKFATLAFEEVIYNFLPGSFDEWQVMSHEGGNVVYRSKHGKMAFCRLMKWGRIVSDFDREDKPQRRSRYTVFSNGSHIECNDTASLARAVADIICNKAHHIAPARRVG